MIDEKKLIETFSRNSIFEKITNVDGKNIYEIIEDLPKTGKWIPCSERLPEEHDSMFKKFKGTNKWHAGMFESISNKVNVTIEFNDKKRATDTSYTIDGKWKCEKDYGVTAKVIAWMPLPEPYQKE